MLERSIKRVGLIALGVLAFEIAYALFKPSPILESFDPSGEFGDPSHPEFRVAVLGDSSVTAPGVTSREEIWVTRICRRMADRRHVVMRSFAVGGSMAHDVVAEQLDAAIDYAPDLYLVSVGANDAIKGVPLRRFAANLDYLIGMLASTDAIVIQSGVGVLGTIPRLFPPLSALMTARSARFDRVHRQVAARYGTSVIDQRDDDPRLWNRDRSLWAADHFHVSAAGHARWTETTWRTLGPLVNGDHGQN